jgi:hypothetical protein
MSGVPTSANAESRAPLNIADHDGIYVDGRSFKVIPGTASGDASALIGRSGARELGPAAIVFRRGDKLYLATVPPDQQNFGSDRQDYGSDRRDYGSDRDESPSTAQSEREWREWQQSQRQSNNRRDYGSDRRDYGSDRRDYGSDRDESPSTAQSEREWREWQQSQRQSNNRRDFGSDRRDYGSDRRDYGSDRHATELNRQTARISDPEYAQYKLKRFFDENWTVTDTR